MLQLRFTALSIFASLIFIAGPAAHKAAAQKTPVKFENSCGANTAVEFDHAVTMLHSFEYPESEKLFRGILESNPTCAMARWGIAMSLWHPLWVPPGPSALKSGSDILKDIEKFEATPREAAYIDAVKAFYKDYETTKHITRAKEYEKKMSRVYMDHLDDPEAAIFYALAILATVDPKDKSYSQQYKAAAILSWVRSRLPYHPGVLHYTIHSYDYPGLAHLALEVARVYAKAAPNSAHAQHMPSHIFTRLGLWEEAASSNHDSTVSADAYTKRAKLHGHYDEGLHSTDYLIYAYLQTSQDREAQMVLEKLRHTGLTDTENFKVAYTLASSPARYALERREWAEAGKLELLRREDFPWKEFGWALSIHHFARGIGAARSGQVERAREELGEIEKIRASMPEDSLVYWVEQVSVHNDMVKAWIYLDEGNIDEALRLARAAADREDSVDKHPVTPGEVLPARELYADMLLEVGRNEEALENYRIELTNSPNRFNGLIGAARAASRLGNDLLARKYYGIAVAQAKNGSPGRSGVKEARDYLQAPFAQVQ